MTDKPSLLYGLSGLGMMLVFFLAAAIWRRGRPGIWPLVGLGMLAWTVAVAVKFAVGVPLNGLVRRGLVLLLGTVVAAPLFWLYVGLLTGVFECGITLWFASKTRLRRADWNQAVAFGIGFGGFEALVLGFLLGIGLLVATLFFDKLPAEAKAQFAGASQFEVIRMVLPVVERISALFIHVFSCVAIVFALQSRRWRWFWMAFGYKTFVDALAIVGIERFQLETSVRNHAWFELTFVALGLAGLAGLRTLRSEFRNLDSMLPDAVTPS